MIELTLSLYAPYTSRCCHSLDFFRSCRRSPDLGHMFHHHAHAQPCIVHITLIEIQVQLARALVCGGDADLAVHPKFASG
jgi:hypothetical protein